MSKSLLENDQKTIRDFGEQWTHYQDNEGYYSSKELLADVCGSLLSFSDITGTKVADIGSGTGRIVNMLLDAGAEKVIAIEPSAAFEVLKKNTKNNAHQIEYLNISGVQIPENLNLDYIFSIGVIHHIRQPEAIIAAAYKALKPGGRALIWLYGYEGNEMYLRFALPLRKITIRLPHFLLAATCHFINLLVDAYIIGCKFFKLPLRNYINNVLKKLSRKNRYLVIYDQLNPLNAKYYKKDEARALLEKAGFKDVELYHRHNYSWTVIGIKP